MFRFSNLMKTLRSDQHPEQDPGTAPGLPGLEERLIEALRGVYDPEIPINIFDLGLIYDIAADASGAVQVRMTLTAPACPVAGSMPGQVEAALRAVEGVTDAQVELVWDPPWSAERMSDEARLQLGLL